MRRFKVFLTFLLILTACTAPAQTSSVNEPESQTLVLDGTFETSVLVAEWKSNSESDILFPLNPADGNPLPDYPPISLDRYAFHAFTPDRKVLAVVNFPGTNEDNGELLLIDLSAWKTRRLKLDLSGWVSAMAFSPDGKRLAITHGESRHQLTIVNADAGVITAQGPIDSLVTRLKFTEDGQAVMLYSQGITPIGELSPKPPQVFLLDTETLSPRWSAILKDVRDGIFPKDNTITPMQFYEPGNAFSLSPGLVFAPDRDALYIVHADSEQLTTVDFGTQKIKTVEIHANLSWFDHLLSLTASVAHAKVADGTQKQAVVSPNGQSLYVVSSKNSSSQDQQGNWEYNQTPLGLEIIQTRDGTRLQKVETDATELSISPDGHFLYLKNWIDTAPSTEILDTSTRQLIARKEAFYATPVLLVNGQYLLASTYVSPDQKYHMSILQPSDLSVLADWIGPDFVYWLPTP